MVKLGRTNGCILLRGEIETANDISGVVFVGLDHAGAWEFEMDKELKACGYKLPWVCRPKAGAKFYNHAFLAAAILKTARTTQQILAWHFSQ